MRAQRLIRVVLLPGAVAALLALALAAGARLTPATTASPRSAVDATRACTTVAGATTRLSVAVAGQGTRTALVHLPRHPQRQMALMLALHGAYGNGAFMERYSALSLTADRAGFAVIYPDAAGPRWKITNGEGSSDVQFLDTLLDRVLAGGCFDASRIYAVGVSNGGGMAARFACAGDDRLAGLVAVAGAYGTLPGCLAKRPLSVLEIHGTADKVVPYNGTAQDPRSRVLSWVRQWVDRDACDRVPDRVQELPEVLRFDWTQCRGGTSVTHLELIGGTHAWPGADPPDPGPQLGVSAPQEAWAFLRNLRLASD
jgi:polyhydroxybutyrate depolymerase